MRDNVKKACQNVRRNGFTLRRTMIEGIVGLVANVVALDEDVILFRKECRFSHL